MTPRHDSPADSSTAASSGLIWERPEPPARRSPGPLSRALIVTAALELADADGLEGVSFRRVAAALEVGPMRLYGYVETKAELLELMVDAAYGEIAPRTASGRGSRSTAAGASRAAGRAGEPGWREELRAIAERTRLTALRHEWFTELLGGRPHLGPNALAVMEAVLAAVQRVPGLADDPTGVQRAAGVFHAYLTGTLRVEVGQRQAERSEGRSDHDWQAAMGPYLVRTLAAGRHPTVARVMAEAEHLAPGEQFAAGLELVLDGIAAQSP
ncbi:MULTISPECIES: TetR/AcrR family transcriptional regulator C-terminal domain-containing protein [Kitasatospora]|uniref:Putative TetR family transcriptional regulator n=1 Tax=Kitasatospora setae (strain ATCC 33774 / DSM 43861 / JCM 3304 / KCC A-0304 / NBRC 14216 / KM-6054) TaxID=452652 RepID=E4N4L1_KITSK|nr:MULTISPECIES: TetR/AcrR family transcriptional regulator C-terminal domain-containing protein [Kitasatospora]BAJ26142.1 putative TetR family transcriptional regulator [Kitasatospora setae KM-6054]